MVQIKYPGRQQLWSNSTQENNPSAHPLWVLWKMQKQVYKSGDGTSWAYRKCERRFRNQEERETHQISLGMAASLITCQNLICNPCNEAEDDKSQNISLNGAAITTNPFVFVLPFLSLSRHRRPYSSVAVRRYGNHERWAILADWHHSWFHLEENVTVRASLQLCHLHLPLFLSSSSSPSLLLSRYIPLLISSKSSISNESS